MPWMPGTTIVGLQSSAAKSVRARTRKPTIASVQRIERTERPPEGLGGGRYAHAAVGRPQRGQKWPRNTVPQRGHGHPGAAAAAAGKAVVGAGVPHRGQKDPSNVAPHRTHCICARRGARDIYWCGPRSLGARLHGGRASARAPRIFISDMLLRGPPRAAEASLEVGGVGMEYEDRSRRNVDVEFETIKSEKVNFGRNNFLEIARKRAKTSEGTNEFISVSRGYYLPDKTERFKRSLTIPDDPEVRAFVADKIRSL